MSMLYTSLFIDHWHENIYNLSAEMKLWASQFSSRRDEVKGLNLIANRKGILEEQSSSAASFSPISCTVAVLYVCSVPAVGTAWQQ